MTGHEGEVLLPLASGIKFAAPEVVQNTSRRDASLKAHVGVDTWAVGLLAFELVTGQPFFPAGASSEQQRAMLAGEKPFSFGRDSAVWAGLGSLEDVVRRMVCMEPLLRPAVRELATLLREVTVSSKARLEASHLS